MANRKLEPFDVKATAESWSPIIPDSHPIHDASEIADLVVVKLREEAGFKIDDATVTAHEILSSLRDVRFVPLEAPDRHRLGVVVSLTDLLSNIRKRVGR